MESDNDLHDADELLSVEENDDGDYSSEDEAVEEEVYDYSDDFVPRRRSQKNYTILKEEDIRRCQDEDIAQISTVLSISREAACLLLCHYNWSVNDAHEKWFSDEERVRNAVGILEKPLVKFLTVREMACGICFDDYFSESLRSAGCAHMYCDVCWKVYISTSINDGPGCLTLRCPDPSCDVAVGQEMINKLATNEEKDKYSRYLLRSYVENSHKIKWCPAPGCDSAVKYFFGSGSYDVTCSCSYSFCWNCTEEAHRPVDCETVAKWVLKNLAESENMNWILTNSKPCPKCKRRIEKSQGCMHMTCTASCKFEFCWLCLGAWSDHGERTGGFYACNHYKAEKQEGKYDEAERRREMAKNSLEKYTHYYERWSANQMSRKKALADLHQMQSEHLAKLSEVQSQPETQLEFVIEALQQIIECRRVLKWTYAYGYYLPESEQTKKQFFEYSQGDAEARLEKLHQCAEKELMNYLKSDIPSNDFDDFRTKLINLTSVTRSYFEKLVRALENGLSDVDSQAEFNQISSESTAGSSNREGEGEMGDI